MTHSVSIAMAVYDGEEFLGEQLDSLASQSCPPDELIVSDDGSSDGTVALVEAFARRAPFDVTVLRHDRNVGYAKNFIRAVDRCRGTLILFADQDDVWHPDKVGIVKATHTRHGPVLVSHDLAIASNRASVASMPSYFAFLDDMGFGPAVCFKGCSLSIHRELIEAWGWPPASCPISHDFWIALLATGLGRRVSLPRPLIRHRLHASNRSGWIVSRKDLAYTDADGIGGRTDLELMIELCLKPWNLRWADGFLTAIDGLRRSPRFHEDIETFASALHAHLARYGRTCDPSAAPSSEKRVDRRTAVPLSSA